MAHSSVPSLLSLHANHKASNWKLLEVVTKYFSEAHQVQSDMSMSQMASVWLAVLQVNQNCPNSTRLCH